jgi:hypothetical protein
MATIQVTATKLKLAGEKDLKEIPAQNVVIGANSFILFAEGSGVRIVDSDTGAVVVAQGDYATIAAALSATDVTGT